MPRLYWEDLQPGSVRELGSASLNAEEIKDFVSRSAPEPFLLEDEAGRRSLFGGLCASGWQTCGLVMRLTVDNMLKDSASLGSPGLESLKWLKPVYPGDRLDLRHTILESRPLRKRPEVGLVRSRWELFNQDGDKVLEMDGYGFFGRRESATAEELAGLDRGRAVG